MKSKWEAIVTERIPKKESDQEYQVRIKRIVKTLYKELSQLESDTASLSEFIEPRKIRATSNSRT